MNTARTLGIDPGSSKAGVADVSLDANGWFHIHHGAHLPNDGAAIRTLIAHAAQQRFPVAIEQISGEVYRKRRATNLFDTKDAEGTIKEIVRAAGGAFVLIPARDWRKELCRQPGASDQQIRIVIEGICKTIPTLRAEERPHVYDGAGAAIVAIMMATGRKLVLPKKVEAALLLRQLEEKQLRTERTAKGLPATEPVKLAMSAVSRKRRSDAAKRSWATRRKAG